MEIVYVFVGKLPQYTVDAIHQSRTFSNKKITLICDDLQSPYLKQIEKYAVNIVPYQSVINHTFIDCVNENFKKFCIPEKLGDRKLLFIRSFERFFLLENYMKLYNLSNVLFLELDVLIYFDPSEFLDLFRAKETTMVYVNKNQMCSGLSFFKNIDILQSMNNFFIKTIVSNTNISDDGMSEMSSIMKLMNTQEFRNKVLLLPGLWKDSRYSSDVWENYHLFNSLFDGAGIAIYIDGPDFTHRDEWIKRNKVWWGTDVIYNDFQYKWKEINNKRIVFLTDPSGNDIKVNCLHVHNKNLKAFLSTPCQEFIPVENDYIQGYKFLLMADAVLRSKNKSYYEILNWDKNNIFYFEDLNENWNNPKLLYCNTDEVPILLQHLDKLQNQFVLLSHNSDFNVTQDLLPLTQSPKLIHWFTQNLCAELPKTSLLPIGLANPCWNHGDIELFKYIQSLNSEKKTLIYANFLIETNPVERQKCADFLKSISILIWPRMTPFDNLTYQSLACFSICPEGNGKDTHRFWESLLCKTIPIVIRSPLTENLAKDFPCILLNSWEQLLTAKLEYNAVHFSQEFYVKLSFTYYKNKILQKVSEITA